MGEPRAVAIYSIMTLPILASLIWGGVVPTRQEANTYQLRQTTQETFTYHTQCYRRVS